MHKYISPIAEKYKKLADVEIALGQKAYMLNQFEYYGIKTPERKKLFKEYVKKTSLDDLKELEAIVKELWQLEQREYQYFAIELLAHHKKLWKKSSIKLMEYCITHKSWWDTVDFISTQWTGPYFEMFPEQIVTVTGKWNKGDNMWLQRSSLLFQKFYKEDTDTDLLGKYILHVAGSKEFFIRKAIGWALRQYAYTNPKWVKGFVRKNELSPLSKKEALKNL